MTPVAQPCPRPFYKAISSMNEFSNALQLQLEVACAATPVCPEWIYSPWCLGESLSTPSIRHSSSLVGPHGFAEAGSLLSQCLSPRDNKTWDCSERDCGQGGVADLGWQ